MNKNEIIILVVGLPMVIITWPLVTLFGFANALIYGIYWLSGFMSDNGLDNIDRDMLNDFSNMAVKCIFLPFIFIKKVKNM